MQSRDGLRQGVPHWSSTVGSMELLLEMQLSLPWQLASSPFSQWPAFHCERRDQSHLCSQGTLAWTYGIVCTWVLFRRTVRQK